MSWRPPGGWRAALARLRRAARRAVRLPPRELLTTVHVVAVMTVVEMLIRPVRLPRLARLLGVRLDLGAAAPGSGRLRVSTLPATARRQVRCVRRVAGAWPFSTGPCLRQSLTLGHLLRDLDPALRLGVAGSGEGLLAHAWLEIEGQPLEDVSGFGAFAGTPALGAQRRATPAVAAPSSATSVGARPERGDATAHTPADAPDATAAAGEERA